MIHSFTELYHWESLAIMIFYDEVESWPSDKAFHDLLNELIALLGTLFKLLSNSSSNVCDLENISYTLSLSWNIYTE